MRSVHVIGLVTGGVALAAGGAYVALMAAQDDTPVAWFVITLAATAALAFYSSAPRAALGPAALSIAGFALVVVGTLALFSVGLPLFVAGVAAMFSAWRRAYRGAPTGG